MEVVLPPVGCVLPQITCLICCKIPSDSLVYLCKNGHLYCLNCCGSVKGKKCRMMGCKEKISKIMEPILQDIYLNSAFPCNYNLCKQKILGKDLKFHQLNCHYSPITCPECQTMVPFEHYMKHLDTVHKVGINCVLPNDQVQNISIKFPPIESYSVSHYHNYQGGDFFIHVFVKPKDVYLWIQYYGEIWRNLDYTSTVSLKNPYGHTTEITLPIQPITASFTQIQKSLSYAHFSKELLTCYLSHPQPQLSLRTSTTSSSSFAEYSNNNYPGFITFQVTFAYNYLNVFQRNVYQDIQHCGTESYC